MSWLRFRDGAIDLSVAAVANGRSSFEALIQTATIGKAQLSGRRFELTLPRNRQTPSDLLSRNTSNWSWRKRNVIVNAHEVQ